MHVLLLFLLLLLMLLLMVGCGGAPKKEIRVKNSYVECYLSNNKFDLLKNLLI